MYVMRAILSSIILFFYTLTCTGMTVYMHQCHAGSFVLLAEDVENHHQNCPVCAQHGDEKAKVSPHACDIEADNCCKDIKIDLTKGQEEVESTTSSFNLTLLSPATLSIIWLAVLQPHFDELKTQQSRSDKYLLSTRTAPTYLLHCNFRI